MPFSADEQFLLELINRARLDPRSEAARMGVALNDGLWPGAISDDAKQVLAPNENLYDSATNHSLWMLESDTFGHTGVDGSQSWDRMTIAGYDLTGTGAKHYENLALGSFDGPFNPSNEIVSRYATIYESPDHRRATFHPDIREAGLSHEVGEFQGFTVSVVTENFGATGTDRFVTGVVYNDTDGNDFYTIGEGTKNYTVRADGIKDKTEGPGGYSVAVTPAADVSVTVSKGRNVLAKVTMDLSEDNGKLDLVFNHKGKAELHLSTSTDLDSGVSNAVLLGVADLDIAGHNGRNVLTGNSGNNLLTGAAGKDKLYGNDGRDTLNGERGNDVLFGGAGNDRVSGGRGSDEISGGEGKDRLNGGAGKDTFVYYSDINEGRDTILDFDIAKDSIDLFDEAGSPSIRALNSGVDSLLVLDSGTRIVLRDVTVEQADGIDFV